jgi:hypothetical protein
LTGTPNGYQALPESLGCILRAIVTAHVETKECPSAGVIPNKRLSNVLPPISLTDYEEAVGHWSSGREDENEDETEAEAVINGQESEEEEKKKANLKYR